MMGGDPLADHAAMHCTAAEMLPSEAGCPLSQTTDLPQIPQDNGAAVHRPLCPSLRPCRGTPLFQPGAMIQLLASSE